MPVLLNGRIGTRLCLRRKSHRLLLCATLAALCGCHSQRQSEVDRALEHIDIKPLKDEQPVVPRVDIVSGRTLVAPADASSPQPFNASTSIGISLPHTEADEGLPEAGYTGPLAYYMAKCDIYWKLNWIRKTITQGEVPALLGKYITRTRRENHSARQDGNAQVADSALDHLEAGFQHWRILSALESANVRSALVPWSAGASGIQDFIDRGGFGVGARQTSVSSSHMSLDSDDDDDDVATPTVSSPAKAASLNKTQTRAIAVALAFAARYHQSPETLMRNEWEKAIRDINRLRDQLFLQGRKENSDSDTARLDPEALRRAAELSGATGVSVQDFAPESMDGKALARALSEPDNPFGVPSR